MMRKSLRPALVCLAVMTLLCGLLYPVAITAIAQLAFPNQANGSIITVVLPDGTKQAYGSSLIAQTFSMPKYLIGRPSGVTNLSPVSVEQAQLVKARIDWWHQFDPENGADIPMDLVTASGSGVDPHISPAAAEYQVARIAKVRSIPEQQVQAAIKMHTSGRFLGFIGEPAVNVLEVNLTLDGLL